ncbi:hypothetical protein D3C77_571210 [compost metagenome]
MTNVLQHDKVFYKDHAVYVFQRIFLAQITEHPVNAFPGRADHVGEIRMRNLFVDQNVIALLLAIGIAETNQGRAERSRLAVHHQVAKFGLRQAVMDTHPFHKVNGKIAMLADQDFEILLFNNADFAVFNYFGGKAVLRAEEGISLADHVSAPVHI